MTTVATSVADTMKIDRIDFSVGGGRFIGSFYSASIERTFTFSELGPVALTADDYPVLAAIWDNEDDAVYDEL